MSTETEAHDRWIPSRYQAVMAAADSSAPSLAGPVGQLPGDQPYLDLSQYERLIAHRHRRRRRPGPPRR